MKGTEEIREQMLSKYRWAETSVARILKGSKGDLELMQQDFWAFLTACQTIKFYHARWYGLNGWEYKHSRPIPSHTWTDCWRSSLNNDLRESWEVILSMRNEDTHTLPVGPEELILDVAVFSDEKTLRVTGQPITVRSMKYILLFRGQQYSLKRLCRNGLRVFKKFIDEFDEPSSFYCSVRHFHLPRYVPGPPPPNPHKE